MKKRGLWRVIWSAAATRLETTQKAPKMRLKVRRLWRGIKRELPIQFGHEQLTSYGGLELVRRYFQLIRLNARIRCALGKHVGGDYGCSHLVLLVIGLLVVGARRLQHLRYLANDSLFARFCGLSRIPSDRTVVNWLKQFTQTSLRALMRLNSELLYEQIQKLGLRRLTIDLDGTVIRTGDKVAWAMRGFNPHHPKDPSYYPLLAHLAQTGQILRLKNRPGNVHDSKGAERFVRELIGEIRTRLGCALTLEFRMDAAFFQQKSAQAVQPPGLLVRGQSTLVSVDRGESPDRRPSAVDGGHWRYRLLRDPA